MRYQPIYLIQTTINSVKELNIMKNIKSTIACILSLLIMTGGMATAPVSSETAPAFNSVKLDGDVREALETVTSAVE